MFYVRGRKILEEDILSNVMTDRMCFTAQPSMRGRRHWLGRDERSSPVTGAIVVHIGRYTPQEPSCGSRADTCQRRFGTRR